MLEIRTEIDIDAPLERVWSILVDFPAYSRWNPYVVRIDGEARAGADIQVHTRSDPERDMLIQSVRVISVDRTTMRWEGGAADRSVFKGDHWWVLESSGSCVRLRHFEFFSGEAAAGILTAHGDAIRLNFIRFNNALKVEAEHSGV